MTFSEWMNRPVKRAQVFTWGVYQQIVGKQSDVIRVDMSQTVPESLLFRANPRFRTATTRAIRNRVASVVKVRRRRHEVTLPRYQEATGRYA